MSHTDPIADMLTRIRNGIMAEKKEVAVPLSTIKVNIAKILKEEGYIENFKVENDEFPPQLVLTLKYLGKKQNAIEGIKRVSTPGRRVFAGKDELPKVLDGMGMAVLSTSQGLMTTEECHKRNIGGEVLLNIW
jgi:small subunit ribosomal protein S8